MKKTVIKTLLVLMFLTTAATLQSCWFQQAVIDSILASGSSAAT